MANFENFSSTAKSLSRNPLGIVALFVVLVYALACLVFALSPGLSETEHFIFVLFIVLFPVLIFLFFVWIVTVHHIKLYAPSDFSDEKNFVSLIEKIDQKIVDEINEKVAELEDQFEYEIAYLRLTSAKLQKRYDVAIDWANGYLDNNKDSEMLVQKAYCLWEVEKNEQSLICINEAFSVDNFKHIQNKATAYFNRACYRATLGKSQELAIEDLKLAISINNKYIEQMQRDHDLSSIDTKSLAEAYNK